MFYIKENDKIVLFDTEKQKLLDTLEFTPQYKDTEILETDKEIVEYKGNFYFSDDNEYITQKYNDEKERISKLSLTKREVFLALYKSKSLTPEMVRNQITDPEALIEFDYATEYVRENPLIDKIGKTLGFAPQDLDYLFINKTLPEND